MIQNVQFHLLYICIACVLPMFAPVGIYASGTLYSTAYGDSTKPAVLFIHGGPGYNSVNFEISTAEELSKKGFYVIVFDQRGCARSKGVPSAYTLAEAVQDVYDVCIRHRVRSISLLGHSWGGVVAAMTALQHPELVKKVILCGAPISFPQTLRSILNTCTERYKRKSDTANIRYMDILRTMDTLSLEYSSYLFYHAMTCGLYKPESPTASAKDLYKQMSSSPLSKYLRESEFAPVKGFHANEHYTSLNIEKQMKQLRTTNIPCFGIYGMEDGLFDREQLSIIRSIVGDEGMHIVSGASHNVFIDQQEQFLTIISGILTK
jgi:proline iminopeptidase